MSTISILMIEPDQSVSGSLSMILRNALYHVETVSGGTSAMTMFGARHYDMLIVDRTLPDMDGCRLCLEFRRIDSDIPLLMLAQPGNNIVLESYSAGIDEFLLLPIDCREFLARVRAVIRRALPGAVTANRIRTGDIVLDYDSKLVHKAGKLIAVTASEYLLLEYMMRNKNRVITREELVSGAWGKKYRCRQLNLQVHMNNLRNKLKDGDCPHHLYTVSRKGYLLAENETPTWKGGGESIL